MASERKTRYDAIARAWGSHTDGSLRVVIVPGRGCTFEDNWYLSLACVVAKDAVSVHMSASEVVTLACTLSKGRSALKEQPMLHDERAFCLVRTLGPLWRAPRGAYGRR